MMIGRDFQFAAVTELAAIILMAGYDADSVWFEVSNDTGKTVTPFRNGDTRREVGPGNAERPAAVILATGEIMVFAARGSELVSYLSVDAGESWQVVDVLR